MIPKVDNLSVKILNTKIKNKLGIQKSVELDERIPNTETKKES